MTFDPKTDPDVGDFFGKLPDADYLPTWYNQRIGGALGPGRAGGGAEGRRACQYADDRPFRQLWAEPF